MLAYWLSIIIPVIVAIAAIVGLCYRVLRDRRADQSDVIRKRFLEIRTYIKSNRNLLHDKATKLCDDKLQYLQLYEGIPLIVGEQWIPKIPVALTDLKLTLDDDIAPVLLPKKQSIAGYSKYSDAINSLDKPNKFIDNRQYRLLNIKPLELVFSKSRFFSYFDKINFGGYLDYEMAETLLYKKKSKVRNMIMSNLKMPSQYTILSGVNTLTLLNKNGQLRLIMHLRGKKETAYAMGVYHVIPAGEFQPSCVASPSFKNDFDLWKNIIRETAEELAGFEEYDGNSATPFTYDQAPFTQIQNEFNAGNIKPFYLGIGLDPLTFQAEILTCVVYNEDSFASIFPTVISENAEGKIITDKERWGINFIEDEVKSYFSDNTLASAKAILKITLNNLDLFRNCL